MDNLTFEQALARVDEINARIATGQATLDESLDLYKEASALLAHCAELLRNAELEVEEVTVTYDDQLG